MLSYGDRGRIKSRDDSGEAPRVQSVAHGATRRKARQLLYGPLLSHRTAPHGEGVREITGHSDQIHETGHVILTLGLTVGPTAGGEQTGRPKAPSRLCCVTRDRTLEISRIYHGEYRLSPSFQVNKGCRAAAASFFVVKDNDGLHGVGAWRLNC